MNLIIPKIRQAISTHQAPEGPAHASDEPVDIAGNGEPRETRTREGRVCCLNKCLKKCHAVDLDKTW